MNRAVYIIVTGFLILGCHRQDAVSEQLRQLEAGEGGSGYKLELAYASAVMNDLLDDGTSLEIVEKLIALHAFPQARYCLDHLEKSMADRPKSSQLLKLVKVGSQRAFKVWKLSTALKITSWVLGVLALVFFFWACWRWSSVALLTVGAIGTTAAALIAGAIVGKKVMRMVRYRDTLTEIAIGIAMSLLGWLVARIHLHVFDRWFLLIGRVRDRND